MRRHELVSCFAIALLAPALGQHEFLFPRQHREPLDPFEIPAKPSFLQWEYG